MAFDIDAYAIQHRQPHVAERRVFRENEMLPQLEIRSAAGEDGGAIGEVVDGTDI